MPKNSPRVHSRAASISYPTEDSNTVNQNDSKQVANLRSAQLKADKYLRDTGKRGGKLQAGPEQKNNREIPKRVGPQSSKGTPLMQAARTKRMSMRKAQ